MDQELHHIEILDKKITALSDALAHLGQGTSLKELLRIIRFPGWTTPAEFALVIGMVDAMHVHTHAMARMQKDLLEGAKLIVEKSANPG